MVREIRVKGKFQIGVENPGGEGGPFWAGEERGSGGASEGKEEGGEGEGEEGEEGGGEEDVGDVQEGLVAEG